jgi:hypothetical protein
MGSERPAKLTRPLETFSTRCSGGLTRSVSTAFRHRTAVPKPRQARNRRLSTLPSILPPSSRVAFCVSPICPTTPSTASVDMKQPFGVGQVLFALDALDRRKPQERRRRFRVDVNHSRRKRNQHRRLRNHRAPRCEPWSVLKISGANASSSVATQNAVSLVIDSRHDSTRRLNQSSTTAR